MQHPAASPDMLDGQNVSRLVAMAYNKPTPTYPGQERGCHISYHRAAPRAIWGTKTHNKKQPSERKISTFII